MFSLQTNSQNGITLKFCSVNRNSFVKAVTRYVKRGIIADFVHLFGHRTFLRTTLPLKNPLKDLLLVLVENGSILESRNPNHQYHAATFLVQI